MHHETVPVKPFGNSSKAELLRAASDLMIERGSIEMTLIDIARKSELNSALVKYYFGSKGAMMIALLEQVLGPGIVELNNMLSLPISPVEKLKVHIRGITRTYFRYPYISALIHGVSQDPANSELVTRTILKPLIDAQARLLSEGIAAGVFRDVEPMLIYFIIVGTCDKMFYGRHLLREGFSVQFVTRELAGSLETALIDLLTKGILI